MVVRWIVVAAASVSDPDQFRAVAAMDNSVLNEALPTPTASVEARTRITVSPSQVSSIT